MAQTPEIIALKRDCSAIAIPSGNDVTLYEGTEVRVTQALGGTFTVVTHQGAMASIAGRDADALGLEVPPESREEKNSTDHASVEKQVWKKLRTCYDPEIPHNIVDLGLVYECSVNSLNGSENEYQVAVKMTLTAPGCGMGDWLKKDAENKIRSVNGVKECRVEVVFDPPWNPDKMSPALRREMF